MSQPLTHDPHKTSHYISDELYRDVIAMFTDWQGDDRLVADPAERERFRMLIEKEARLLDQDNLEAWLSMFTPECVYWLPTTPNAGDPRREITISFDDRRRLEDRVYRLRTGYAWSQAPKSRTVRMVTNVEVFTTAEPGARMVRSNFLISEFRGSSTRWLNGWCGYRFVEQPGGPWLIQARQLNLIDCDQNLRNPSIVL
ncbi:MAG: aromatic-ring-hydroxylating dioxygenase beta subunit [Xanthobacteraceae bacterium]|nr:aromatic-ring-hydroxylating dioxygenase beta subunit [Xanthobacteraceae bacterium]